MVCQSLVYGQMPRVSQLFEILTWTDLGYVSLLFWTTHRLHVSESAPLLVVPWVPLRWWQSTVSCCRPENKGGMCPKLGQSGARRGKGPKDSEKHDDGQSGKRKTKKLRGLLMLWRVCMLDSTRSASKWQTVTVMVEGGGAGWSEREAVMWSMCVRDSARSALKLKTCSRCNTGSVSRENKKEKESYGTTLNLVLLTDAPYMFHSLW